MIIQLKKELLEYKFEIAEAILASVNNVHSVWLRVGSTKGVFREPKLECLAGSCNPIVLHREENTSFLIDISKLTFSPGNAGERKKLVKIVKKGEIVVDMFACCGNLSMPIAVNSKPRLIFGIEINPYAYSFLQDNIRINKVGDRYVAILGDNRISTPERVANHVLMGFFGVDKKQLECAVRAVKNEGLIHLHFLAHRSNPKEKLKQYLNWLDDLQTNYNVNEIDKVKSYAPNINHFVARIYVKTR